jgi:hypothetical protein
VSLNTVDNIETFLTDVKNGRWEAVLPQIAHLRLPTAKLFDLYEQVVLEMIELRETEAASIMLHSMKVFRRLQQEAPERYSHLETLCNPCAPAVQACNVWDTAINVYATTFLPRLPYQDGQQGSPCPSLRPHRGLAALAESKQFALP